MALRVMIAYASAAVVQFLRRNAWSAQKATAAGAPPEEREDDDAEGEAAAASASYDYLLSMPIHSLTHEKARRPDYAPLVTPCLPVHTFMSSTP